MHAQMQSSVLPRFRWREPFGGPLALGSVGDAKEEEAARYACELACHRWQRPLRQVFEDVRAEYRIDRAIIKGQACRLRYLKACALTRALRTRASLE